MWLLQRVFIVALCVVIPAPPIATAAGRTCGGCAVPSEAQPVDTSNPDHVIDDTFIWNCPSDGFWTPPYEWLFYLGLGDPQITNSTFDVPAPDLFCDAFESGDALAW